MNPLSAAFVDAFLAEQARYRVETSLMSKRRACDVVLIDGNSEVARHIVERCMKAGARALRQQYPDKFLPYGPQTIHAFLCELAGDAP